MKLLVAYITGFDIMNLVARGQTRCHIQLIQAIDSTDLFYMYSCCLCQTAVMPEGGIPLSSKLREYFPMIWEKDEILAEIRSRSFV